MIKNYLKIAFRSIRRNPVYSFINILGLAVGIALCILIFHYVSYELSFDEYHTKSEHIYRIGLDHPQAQIAVTPSMLLPTLQQNYPEVETGVRIFDVGKFQPLVVRYEDRVFEERKLAYFDSTLFEVFDFELISGDPDNALTQPHTMVINQATARKYFGNESPVGKVLEVGNRDFEITGVIRNIPSNSHFQYDFLASIVTREGWSELSDNTWRSANFYTYLVLSEGASVTELNQKVHDYIREHIPDNEFVASLNIIFEPLTDIHLHSRMEAEIAPQGDIRYIAAASAIAFLILIIACINYMNLATARSNRRAREVGIRKVLGSERSSLIRQFYGESAALTLIAIAFTILLVELFLPWFNQLTGQTHGFDYLSWQFWGFIIVTGIVVTLVAGSYPALLLSSFKPVSVLKGTKIAGGNPRLRKFLVITQFTATIFLIICTMIIYNQIQFIQDIELGYKKDNVLVLTAHSDVENRFNALEAELLQLPGVQGITMISETPTSIRASYSPDVEGIEEGPNFVVQALRTTPGFTEALNIEVVAGRSFTRGDFTRANQSENRDYAMLVNEATAAHFGVEPEELIGRNTTIGGGSGPIVGVVNNFHFAPLHTPIEPLFIFPQVVLINF
ncbi:MAG: ABC transporter permease [Balneolaceae bacterium]